MQIHHGLDSFRKLSNAIVTSGTFDGVHVGHRKILDRLQEVAQKNHGETVVITFSPHPRIVLYPEQSDLKLLTSLTEKAALLRDIGIDHLVVIKFDKDFAKTTSEAFIQDILLKQIGTKKLVIGYDHKFGRNREGSFEYLKEHAPSLGFEVEEIPKQDVDDVAVSSTKIRKALQKGDVSIANSYLNSNYVLTGLVVEGKKIGREIGFPTANIEVSDPYKLIPADGIYAVKAEVADQHLQGMMYIGPRPTLGNELAKTIEVNLFEFDMDIYGEVIKIEFIQKLREDEKFDGLEALKKQLHQDQEDALKVFSQLNA